MDAAKSLEDVGRCCPECGAPIPIDPRYPIWCDECNWNLSSHQAGAPRTVFEAWYAKLGDRAGHNLYEELRRADALRPAVTPSRLLGLANAAAVHGLTLLITLLGLWLLLRASAHPVDAALAVLCLAVGWFVRPRPARMPDGRVRRDEFPTLYGLADAISVALEMPPVDTIVLTAAFNAFFVCTGWRRRRILGLGLPLLTILNEREIVAVVAHELAHAVNGDATRSLFVGSALTSLGRWSAVLYPLRVALSLGLYELAHLWMRVLAHALWRDQQRAEYLADHLAARVAGTGAMLSALGKMHYTGVYAQAVRRTVAGPEPHNLFQALRQGIAALPERERERLRRVQRMESSRLDATHPPTATRIALLEARPIAQAALHVAPDTAVNLNRELARAEERVQGRLMAARKKRT